MSQKDREFTQKAIYDETDRSLNFVAFHLLLLDLLRILVTLRALRGVKSFLLTVVAKADRHAGASPVFVG